MFILNLMSTTFLEQVGTGAAKDKEMKPGKHKLGLYFALWSISHKQKSAVCLDSF